MKLEFPAKLVAGDTWAWSDASAFSSHPPPEWALRYVLRPLAGGSSITILAAAGSDAFTLSQTASETAPALPGEYEWHAVAFHAANGDRAVLGAGRVTVLPDPLQAGGDLRSTAERILAAIDATIEGRVTKDAESWTIEGRSIARTPLADLLRLRAVYAAQAAAERTPGASPIRYRRIAL
jgi:hypothetical protein